MKTFYNLELADKTSDSVSVRGWLDNNKPPADWWNGNALKREYFDDYKAHVKKFRIRAYLYISREFALSVGNGDLITFANNNIEIQVLAWYKSHDTELNCICIHVKEEDTEISLLNQ